MIFRDLPVKWKLMVLITATSVFVLLTSIAASLLYDRNKFRQSLVSELSVLSQTISADLRAAIVFGYSVQAGATLKKLGTRPTISAACVYAQGQVLFAQYSSGQANSTCPQSPGGISHNFTAEYLDHISEIVDVNGVEPIGILLLRSNFTALHERFIADIYFFMSILVLSSTLAFFLAAKLHRVISDPIRALADTAAQVAREADYSVRSERKSNDEVGNLVTAFNDMMSEIERRDAELAARSEELRKSHKQLEEYSSTLEGQVDRSRETLDYLRDELKKEHNFEEIIGDSPLLHKVLNDLARVAVTDTTILIQGETGTGKELLACAVHNFSERNQQPLIKVNCAALPRELIESELFGHEKGAFTGATEQRKGRFELADNGSIFLDEISELSQEAQAKLLRVLQEREFHRVGGTQSVKVDVRVIAATNKDLQAQVSSGVFRDDLFYRLNVFTATVPPLRERPEDIPLLARHFTKKIAAHLGKDLRGISPPTLAELQQYSWPGNVRELENVIERSTILSNGPYVEIDGPLQKPGSELTSRHTLEEMERHYISDVLEEAGWTVEGPRGAATVLGLKPSTLRSRLQKLGIKIKRDLH